MLEMRRLPSLRFVCERTGKQIDDFGHILMTLAWEDLSPENFEHNTLNGLLRSSEWKTPLKGVQALFPGMHWSVRERRMTCDFFAPGRPASRLDDFVNASAEFFSRIGGRRIGVQLSGGVDSSLIVGLLQHLGIPYSLVGMSTRRYEFRTERHVQEVLAGQCSSFRLIDYEGHLPLSNVQSAPAHEYPDVSLINFSADQAMAKAAAELGVETLLSGSGGDVVLGTQVPAEPGICDWQPSVFNYPWPKDIVYAAHGVQLESFYADTGVVNCLYHLRRGHAHDPNKHWARRYFRAFLPSELCDYTYRADFWGIYMDGLASAQSELIEIHEKAYKITGHSYFEKENLEELLGKDLLLRTEKTVYQQIEARAAFSAWINLLHTYRESSTSPKSLH